MSHSHVCDFYFAFLSIDPKNTHWPFKIAVCERVNEVEREQEHTSQGTDVSVSPLKTLGMLTGNEP